MVPNWQQNNAKQKLTEGLTLEDVKIGMGIFYGTNYGMDTFYKTKGDRLNA